MTKKELLVKAMIPLELLYMQIKAKPYKELSEDFQQQLIESIDTLRTYIFSSELAQTVPSSILDIPDTKYEPWGDFDGDNIIGGGN